MFVYSIVAVFTLLVLPSLHCFDQIKVEPSGYITKPLEKHIFGNREKRDVDPLEYARPIPRPGPGTRVIHGYGQRFAPYEWPKWYVWHIEQFNSPNKIVASPSGGNSMGHGWQK